MNSKGIVTQAEAKKNKESLCAFNHPRVVGENNCRVCGREYHRGLKK